MYEHTRIGEAVWDLHLAFVEAAVSADGLYSVSAQGASDIFEYTENHEEELALTDILGCATPPLPPELRERTLQVARAVWPGEPDADGQVDAWLRWSPGCGTEPPYAT
jgi:hypothetical protein